MLLLLLVINHLVACVWMLLPSWVEEGGEVTSWVSADQACNEWAYTRLEVRYLRTLYYSITVLSTVGYGDIKPATPLETCFMMCVVVLSTSLFATLIGLISSYIRTRDSEAESQKSQLDYIEHYMSYRKMPKRVRRRIYEYFVLIRDQKGVSQASGGGVSGSWGGGGAIKEGGSDWREERVNRAAKESVHATLDSPLVLRATISYLLLRPPVRSLPCRTLYLPSSFAICAFRCSTAACWPFQPSRPSPFSLSRRYASSSNQVNANPPHLKHLPPQPQPYP